jgi:hypothetical protein
MVVSERADAGACETGLVLLSDPSPLLRAKAARLLGKVFARPLPGRRCPLPPLALAACVSPCVCTSCYLSSHNHHHHRWLNVGTRRQAGA